MARGTERPLPARSLPTIVWEASHKGLQASCLALMGTALMVRYGKRRFL